MPDDILEEVTAANESGNDVDLLSEGSEEEKAPPDENKEEKVEDDSLSGEADESEGEEESEAEESEVEEKEPSEEEEEKSAKTLSEDEAIENGHDRATWKWLKTKFPGIEENRGVREVFFSENNYREVFPTVEDARIAAEHSNELMDLGASLAEGDPSFVLRGLQSSNPEVVRNLAEKILPALYGIDKNLYAVATKDHVASLIHAAYDRAVTTKDDNFRKAVGYICNFLYGEPKLPPKPGERRDPEIERQRAEVAKERQGIFLEKQNRFQDEIDRSIERGLSKVLEDGLNVKGDFLKRSIIKETISEMKNSLRSNPTFVREMKVIFSQAARAGFAPEYKTRIIQKYLQRARSVALTARAKIKASALGERRPEQRDKRVISSAGKDNGKSNRQGNPNKMDKKDIYRKFTDEELLNR